MGLVVGIDLGTTNSAVSLLKNGRPEIIVNESGDRITPSAVFISESGEIIVGDQAKRSYVRDGDKTVLEVKRLMGSNAKVKLGDKEYTPQEISAYILRHIKNFVEERMGQEVTEAVITVPAKFNDLQRKATKDAGEIAGYKVERMINEPTAAALAYGIDNFENEENILVYDLGGGTFDVTVLELFDGIFDVKSSEGDTELGGKDFDELLMHFIIDSFERKSGISISENEYVLRLLKLESEKIKKELSFTESTTFSSPFLPGVADEKGNPVVIDMRITRKDLENLISEKVDKTGEIVDLAIKNAKLRLEDIDTVLVVGGSTRIPLVKSLLKNKFGNKLKFDVNPDEVVALGAAVQAGIKTGDFKEAEDFIITDVCPDTLGIEIVAETRDGWISGVFDPLILKNTTIPTSNKKTYFTTTDNQNIVNIKVYQGEEPLAEMNLMIGEFEIEGIPEGAVGAEGVDVEFNYDINGMLEVNVVILSTGEKYKKVFGGAGMTEEQKVIAKLNIETDWRKSKLAGKIETIIATAERKMENLDEKGKAQVNAVMNKMKKAVAEDNENLVTQYEDELTELLFDLMDI